MFLKMANLLLLNISPDWVILDIWVLLSFISVDILLAKVFLVLVVCLVVGNNSCGNSLSSKFSSFKLNIVTLLIFVVDFNYLIVYLLV